MVRNYADDLSSFLAGRYVNTCAVEYADVYAGELLKDVHPWQ